MADKIDLKMLKTYGLQKLLDFGYQGVVSRLLASGHITQGEIDDCNHAAIAKAKGATDA